MGGLKNTFTLLKQSWKVLQHDRELMILLVIASVISLALIAGAGGAIFFSRLYETNIAFAVVLGVLVLYLVSVVFTFFNFAIVAGALERLGGGDPSVSSSMGTAWRRIGKIILWATIVFVVGIILSSLKGDRNNKGGGGVVSAIIGSILQVAWELMTFLVEPVIVAEKDKSVFGAMKRSAKILKDTWGSQVGLRFAVSGLYFIGLLIGAAIGALVWFINPVAGVIVGILVYLPFALFLKTLSSVTKAVVYQYTVGNTLPPEVSKENVDAIYKKYKYETQNQ